MIWFQAGHSDPVLAMANHLTINEGPANLPLFAYCADGHWLILTKKRLLDLCNAVWAAKGVSYVFQGQTFQIGGMMELLLCSIPPDVIKSLS